jgi:phospholipid/cholesterol/gamma-HCH transport system substrate-binding protein
METSARYAIVGFFTVASVLAGFLFVHWLHNSGGAGQALYWIRFEQPVIGVRPGVSVLFNGLRVGEVRQVSLSAADPKEVRALVAVDPTTPVRGDTTIVIDSQGLMGSAVVSMIGGSPDAEIKHDDKAGPPTLEASASAGQSLTQAAKATLKKIDDMLGDNSDNLRSAIGNINTFSAALARNADKVDDVLGGLAKLSSGGAAKPQRTFDLATPEIAPGKTSDVQLAIPDLSGLIVFETQRLLVSPHPGEKAQIEGGQWSDTLPKLVQAKILQSLETAGFTHVAKGIEGSTAQYQLILDIRAFEISLDPELQAKVELNAKLAKGGAIVATRDFTGSAPAKSADAPDAAAALGVAFAKVAGDLASWLRGKL